METLGEYLTRERRSDRTALVDATGRTYDAHWLCTSAWKAGNFLRHTGVRRGVTVGIDGEGPLALLSFLGTALLEGRSWVDPPTSLADVEGLRTLVAPADRLDRYDVGSSTQRVCYGGQPTAPDVHHLDAGLWSENPSFPPTDIEPETPLLLDGDPRTVAARSISHGAAVAGARSVAEEFGIDAGTRVVVEASLADPRAIVAGVLAPLVADGVTVLPAGKGADDSGAVDGDVSVTDDAVETSSGLQLPVEDVHIPDP